MNRGLVIESYCDLCGVDMWMINVPGGVLPVPRCDQCIMEEEQKALRGEYRE